MNSFGYWLMLLHLSMPQIAFWALIPPDFLSGQLAAVINSFYYLLMCQNRQRKCLNTHFGCITQITLFFAKFCKTENVGRASRINGTIKSLPRTTIHLPCASPLPPSPLMFSFLTRWFGLAWTVQDQGLLYFAFTYRTLYFTHFCIT